MQQPYLSMKHHINGSMMHDYFPFPGNLSWTRCQVFSTLFCNLHIPFLAILLMSMHRQVSVWLCHSNVTVNRHLVFIRVLYSLGNLLIYCIIINICRTLASTSARLYFSKIFRHEDFLYANMEVRFNASMPLVLPFPESC